MSKEDEASSRTPLTSAFPAWHTLTTWVAIVAVCVKCLPSLESIDELATVDNFSYVVFPGILNIHSVAYIRLLITLCKCVGTDTASACVFVLFPLALSLSSANEVTSKEKQRSHLYSFCYLFIAIWFTSLWMVFLYDGWDQFTSYLPASKLISVRNRLSGIRTMFPFTSWSWNLLGISFTLNTYIAAQAAAKNPVNIWILRTAVVAWDVAAPFTRECGQGSGRF